MKNKRFLSTVVATALVATTMAMPVMAAEQSGSVDVDVTTKTGVLRVEVPTKMAMEIDQFEITQAGSQIASGEFDMTNRSEMDVKVVVTSTADLDTGIKLVASRKAAEDSEGDEAWLAIATKTNDGTTNSGKVYDDLTSGTDSEAKVEEYWELTETNANVATFAEDKTAEQTFYLSKATGAPTYKLAIPDAQGKVGEAYAQFYELKDVTINVDGSTETAQLQAVVNDKDVYVVVDDTTSDPADPAVDGKAMTKIAKGTDLATATPAITWAATNKYYTAEDIASTPASGKNYVYPALDTADTANGVAGFRYVGKLSDAKDTWTADDIKKISISYNITGVTATNYAEVVGDCTYGLYKAPVVPQGPQLSVNATGAISATGLTEEQNWSGLEITVPDGRSFDINANPVEWNSTNWTAENGGTLTGQMGSEWMDYLTSETGNTTFTLTLSDGSTKTVTVAFKS